MLFRSVGADVDAVDQVAALQVGQVAGYGRELGERRRLVGDGAEMENLKSLAKELQIEGLPPHYHPILTPSPVLPIAAHEVWFANLDIARIITQENGKTLTEAKAEMRRAVAQLGAKAVMIRPARYIGDLKMNDHAYDPFWAACAEHQLPVHFHIGASLTTMTFYGQYPWASQSEGTKLAIGGSLLFIGNARVIVNLILAGTFDRHPDLKCVSVESGVGWIPFILETLDYEMAENAPDELAMLKKPPSEPICQIEGPAGPLTCISTPC